METFKPIKLSEKTIQALRKMSAYNKYSINTPLYYQGQTPIVAYFILKGNILLLKKKKVYHKLSKGCLLGYRELFFNTVSSFTALALPNTEICYLDKSSLEEIKNSKKKEFIMLYNELINITAEN